MPGDIWGRRIRGLGETALLLDWRPPRAEYVFSAKATVSKTAWGIAPGL